MPHHYFWQAGHNFPSPRVIRPRGVSALCHRKLDRAYDQEHKALLAIVGGGLMGKDVRLVLALIFFLLVGELIVPLPLSFHDDHQSLRRGSCRPLLDGVDVPIEAPL